MSYRYTLEAALESLQDIGELIRGFPEDGEVPTIELDLSLQKLRNIYELLLVLKKPADLPVYPSLDRGTASAEAITAAAPAAAAAEVPLPAGAAVVAAEETARAQVHVSDPVPAPAPVPVASSATVTVPPSVREKETIAEIPVAQILSDRFKGGVTLHESLHQTLGTESQLHARGKQVDNLLSAIAINDRFTFIRELFHGDSHAFEHAIKALNEAADFNDAYNFMTRNYEWDMNSEAVQLLLDIIRRKHSISRNG